MNTKTSPQTSLIILALLAVSILSVMAEGELMAEAPIVIPDSKGGFDFLQIDESNNRLLANHTGNDTLDVFDLANGRLLKHIATGKAQDVGVDQEGEKYYVSVSREKKVCIIDSKTLEKTGEVKLDGEADAAVYVRSNHCFYVGHDDEKSLWVVDTHKKNVVATITIPAGPEVIIYDPVSDRLFQNIKSNDTMLVIDPSTNTIKQTWSTTPAQKPHGLVFNPKTNHLLCAGANGKLVSMDAATGSVLKTLDIAAGVDQVAFDPTLQRAYCASGKGEISVIEDTAVETKTLPSIKTAPGAKTVACNPKTHDVWIAYADQTSAYVRRYRAQ